MKPPIIRWFRRCGPKEYAVEFTFALWLAVLIPPNWTGWMPLQFVYAGALLSLTAGRLFDAGVSRFWACVMLPTIAVPWLCPLLIPGARPSFALAQFFQSIYVAHNETLGVLALALLAVPIVIGLLPTRRPKPEDSTEPQASPAAHQ